MAMLLLAVLGITIMGLVFIFYNDDLDNPVGSCPPAVLVK